MKRLGLFLWIIFLVFLNSKLVFGQKLSDLAQLPYEELKEKYHSLDKNKPEALVYVKALILKAKIENNAKQLFSGYRTAANYSQLSEKLAYADSMVWAAEKTKDNDILGSAWISKGVIFYNLRDYRLSLDAYYKAESYLKHGKDEFQKYKALYNLALVNSYLGNTDIALTKYEECKTHFFAAIKTSTHPNEEYNNRKYYLFTLHRLANLYQSKGEFKKSGELIETGLKESDDKEFWYERALIEKSLGIQQFYENKYNLSIQTLNGLVPLFDKEDNFDWVAVCDFYIGKNYMALNQKENALVYFRKVDSVFLARNYINPELREAQQILLTHYKEKKDKDEQLHYISRLLEINELTETDFAYLNKTLHQKKEFETAQLLSEKKKLEKSKKAQSSFYIAFLITAGFLLSGAVFWLYKVNRKNKQLKLKIRQLLERPVIDSITEDLKQKNKKSAQLDDEKTVELLEKLKTFEIQKGYLQKGLTLEILAKKMESNRHYLSETINSQLGKNFNSYLNELRINHLIDELKTKPGKRKFTWEAISEELGYANRQSFTRAFKSVTKVSPSFFMEIMEKENLKPVLKEQNRELYSHWFLKN